jgi:N4-gp56 family major capsid protein
MAQTNIATGSASAKKIYDEMLFKTSYKESFWMSRFGSSDQNGPLCMKTKEFGKSGDRVSMDLIDRFNFAARGEGDALEGHEGSLTPNTFNLTLEEKHVLIRYKGKLSARRPAWEIPGAHKLALEERGGEVIDEQIFDALQATDPNKMFYGGSATSNATLTATDLITPKKLMQAKVWAETGGNRTQNAIRKIGVGGKKDYMILLHQDVFFDLWNDPTIQQAYRDAETRGGSNPLWNDADLVWNGMAVYKHENVDIFTNGGAGSDVNYAKGFLIGAGGLAFGWGQRPQTVTETF